MRIRLRWPSLAILLLLIAKQLAPAVARSPRPGSLTMAIVCALAGVVSVAVIVKLASARNSGGDSLPEAEDESEPLAAQAADALLPPNGTVPHASQLRPFQFSLLTALVMLSAAAPLCFVLSALAGDPTIILIAVASLVLGAAAFVIMMIVVITALVLGYAMFAVLSALWRMAVRAGF